jgi:hypothetical protein
MTIKAHFWNGPLHRNFLEIDAEEAPLKYQIPHWSAGAQLHEEYTPSGGIAVQYNLIWISRGIAHYRYVGCIE